MIFAHPRCGSSQLTKIFNVNKICTMYEPFSRGYHGGIYYKFLTENDLESALQLVLSRCQAFKHITDHLNYSRNVFLLEKMPNIFLYRNNFVNASLSFLTAKHTKIWHYEQINKKRTQPQQIYINPYEFLDRSKKIEKEKYAYISICSKSIQITYEDLYGKDGIDYLNKCFEFIGKKIINPKETEELIKPDKKVNKTPWEKTVTNWKEIEDIIIKNNFPMPE